MTEMAKALSKEMEKNERLEKQNKELQEELTEKDKQIEELKEEIKACKFAMAMSEKVEKKLRQENAELRNNGFTVSAMTEQQLKVALEKGEQLEKENKKAKEIIKKLKALYFSPVVTKDDVKKQDEILTEVEQFLSEVKE